MDAQECVNDSYLGIWNCIPPQRPNPFQTFLCKIVRNISIKRYHANTAQKRNSYYDVALGEIDSKYINEVLEQPTAKKNRAAVRRYVAVAACLCILVVLSAIPHFIKPEDSLMNDPSNMVISSPPLVRVNGVSYKYEKEVSQEALDESSVYLGNMQSQVVEGQLPTKNFQSNEARVGAELYQTGENVIAFWEGQYKLYCPTE